MSYTSRSYQLAPVKSGEIGNQYDDLSLTSLSQTKSISNAKPTHEYFADRVDRCHFVGVGLHAYSGTVSHGQEVIDDLKAIRYSRRYVHGGDVRDVVELGVRVILQERNHRQDALGCDQQLQFVAMGKLNFLDILRHALAGVRTEGQQLFAFLRIQRKLGGELFAFLFFTGGRCIGRRCTFGQC